MRSEFTEVSDSKATEFMRDLREENSRTGGSERRALKRRGRRSALARVPFAVPPTFPLLSAGFFVFFVVRSARHSVARGPGPVAPETVTEPPWRSSARATSAGS
jgi:hypothetical protein